MKNKKYEVIDENGSFRGVGKLDKQQKHYLKVQNDSIGLQYVVTWLLNEIDENGQGNLPDALVSTARIALRKAEGVC